MKDLQEQSRLRAEVEEKRKADEKKKHEEAEHLRKIEASWTAHKSEDGQVCPPDDAAIDLWPDDKSE